MNSNEIIKQLRIKAGLSQEELARAAGYSDRSTIAKIESGKIDLTESKITLFAKIFGVTPAYIMGLEEPAPAKQEDDAELLEYLEYLRTRPEARILMSTMRGATKEEVEENVRFIEALRKTRSHD